MNDGNLTAERDLAHFGKILVKEERQVTVRSESFGRQKPVQAARFVLINQAQRQLAPLMSKGRVAPVRRQYDGVAGEKRVYRFVIYMSVQHHLRGETNQLSTNGIVNLNDQAFGIEIGLERLPAEIRIALLHQGKHFVPVCGSQLSYVDHGAK